MDVPPPPLQETIVTPVITEEQDKLTVEDLESSPPISPDEETKRETVELPLKGDETIVQDLENEAQPDSSPSQDRPLNEGEETAIKDDVMKVESIPSLEVTTVDRSAPNTLSEPAAPPGLDTTLVISGSESCLPLQPALDNRGAGLLVSELKSQSASIVSTNDKTSLALRTTHSQTDVDKTRGVEVDLKNVNQISSDATPRPAKQVENIGEGTDTPQLEEEETASKTSLKKVESEPNIEDSPAAPTSADNDSTPSVSGESPPLQLPDQDSTHPPTQQTDKPSEGINIEEDNNTTNDPSPVKKPCNTTTDPPPVKEPCNTTTDPPPVKEPCNTTNDPSPVKEPCDETNKSMDDENPLPQNDKDNESTPQDNKERQEEDGSNLETEPISSNSSPTLSKRTEDSDSRKIDHNTGQSSAVELGNTETTPTSLVQEVPATV